MVGLRGVRVGPRRRRRRVTECGVETLELVAGLPFLGVAALLCCQAISLVRQQDEAETDARVVARAAALCGASRGLVPRDIDPDLARGAVVVVASGQEVRVTVALPPRPLLDLPGFAAALRRAPALRATVAMRREPCD